MARIARPSFVIVLLLALAAGAALFALRGEDDTALPEGIYAGNGRLESDQVDIAARYGGRVRDVTVLEGALVRPGEVLAEIDTAELKAERAIHAADLASAVASRAAAEATVAQRRAQLVYADEELARARELRDRGVSSQKSLDQAESDREAAAAVLEAAIKQAEAAERAIEAAQAQVDLVDTRIADSVLSAPVEGRVLYRLANPGEVVAAGGRVLTLVDFTQIYLEIFVPSRLVGRIELGAEGRIVLDALPEYPIPATVSFVSPEAQFTPKQVETAEERDKLMFKLRLRVPQALVERYIDAVKTGTRGMGYVWTGLGDPVWPDWLDVPPELQAGGGGDGQ